MQANKASILAFTMNRAGDMILSIGFFAIVALFGSLNYSTVFSLVPFMNETAISIIALLLLFGAAAKSANIPFHSWLPGSMEAPTPVSALLHAATKLNLNFTLLFNFIFEFKISQFNCGIQYVLIFLSNIFFKKFNNLFNINLKVDYHSVTLDKGKQIKDPNENFIP